MISSAEMQAASESRGTVLWLDAKWEQAGMETLDPGAITALMPDIQDVCGSALTAVPMLEMRPQHVADVSEQRSATLGCIITTAGDSEQPQPLVFARGETLPFQHGAFEIVNSLSTVTSSVRPEQAVAEMLRVTNDIAVVSVGDWSHVVFESSSSEAQVAGNALINYLLGTFMARGGKSKLGNKLGEIIDAVAPVHAPGFQKEKLTFELPSGDHRDLLLGTVAKAAEAAKQNGSWRINPFMDGATLASDIETVRNAENVSISLPTIISYVVTMPPSWRERERAA